jgi:hypothetical protein
MYKNVTKASQRLFPRLNPSLSAQKDGKIFESRQQKHEEDLERSNSPKVSSSTGKMIIFSTELFL